MSQEPSLLIHDLHKEYSQNNFIRILKKEKKNKDVKIALKNLSLMVDSGHVFGLLGPNGAGKTTAIKIITCNERQDSGTVMIGGKEVQSSISDAFQMIGFCPQEDALWKDITMKEHLQLYAAIRGLPNKQINSLCAK